MVEREFRVVLSLLAIEKLRNIHNIYRIKDSKQLADKIKNSLLIESKQLAKFPDSKPKLRTNKKNIPPFRYSKKWSFKIIFQVFTSNNIVLVNDFMHDKEDPIKWEAL